MKNHLLLFYILFILKVIQTQHQSDIITHNINTFASKETLLTLDQDKVTYNITINRQSSSTMTEPNHCKGHGRILEFKNSIEIFRLNSENNFQNNDDSIYKSITTLDTEEQIMEFQSIGKKFFLVTSSNKFYFLEESQNGALKKLSTTNLPEIVKQAVANKNFFMLLCDYGIILIFSQKVILCSEGSCKQLQGWRTIQHMTHAQFLKVGNKRYILITQNEKGLSIYELSSNNKLIGYKNYDAKFFGQQRVSLFDVSVKSIQKNQIYVLDYLSGLYSLQYQSTENGLSISQSVKILNKTNCYAMDAQGFKYFILNCRVGTTNFLLQVFHMPGLDNYVEHTPIYKYDLILDVQLSKKYYAARSYSGFKFYWSSTNVQYPNEFQKAGQIYLAQAVQVRFKNQGEKNFIYIASLNMIQKYQIIERAAFVSCYSPIATKEQYLITYSYPCDQFTELICNRSQKILFQVWQHTEIKLYKTLVPTIVSFFGVLLIVAIISMLYKKYRKEEQEASLRYATSENEFGLESNR